MPVHNDQKTITGSVEVAAGPGELLAELRHSQAAVADEIAMFRDNLILLSEALTTIAEALAAAQQAKTEITVEKSVALSVLQAKLQEAVVAIRAAQGAASPDPFTVPYRMGGPQTP